MRFGVLGQFLIISLAFALNASPLHAQTNFPFEGYWVLRAENQNLLVFDIRKSSGGDDYTGTVFRPAEVNWGASGDLVWGVKLPEQKDQIYRARIEKDELLLEVGPKGSIATPITMVFHALDQNTGAIRFKGSSIPPMAVSRVPVEGHVAGAWDVTRAYRVDDPRPPNAEMTALLAADQAARKAGGGTHLDLAATDAERRRRTKELLGKGDLHVATDYLNAAVIFQHSEEPNDVLLAHILAMVALKKGRADAVWMAAATLDRYLQDVGKPQVFGSQYSREAPAAPYTQDPYNTSILSDQLRAEFNIPTLADQRAASVAATMPTRGAGQTQSKPAREDP